MRPAASVVRNSMIVLALALAAPALIHAQGGQNIDGKKAEEVYKNIVALKGMQASEFNQTMHLIEAETGMDCTFCHVEGAFDKEDKAPKQIARQMIMMMNNLNSANFSGRRVITCYTCHNGRPIPMSAPAVLPVPRPVLAEPMVAAPKVTIPTADQIFAKYVDALGGEQALRKVTSRVITGTQMIPTGPGGAVPFPATIERLQKAPNVVVNTYRTPTYTIADGFDGNKAWTMSAQGRVTEPLNIDQGRAKRDADLYLPLNLKQLYPTLEVKGIERVNGRDAYLVIGTPQGDLPERLYFDIQNGLLIRKETDLPTPVGNSMYQVNFADYRDTGSGVKFPFQITMNPATSRSVLFSTATIRVTAVQDNVAIDAAKLARPESRPAPPAGGPGRGQ
jgi:photosynthetic reaction center cytochrome c subunit